MKELERFVHRSAFVAAFPPVIALAGLALTTSEAMLSAALVLLLLAAVSGILIGPVLGVAGVLVLWTRRLDLSVVYLGAGTTSFFAGALALRFVD